MFVIALIALGFVWLLAWLTNWPFALHCFGGFTAGLAMYEVRLASPLDVPGWTSSPGAKLVLSFIGLLGLLSPHVIAIIWFRWWWGLLGFALAGPSAGLSRPMLPGIVRLPASLLLWVGAAVVLVR